MNESEGKKKNSGRINSIEGILLSLKNVFLVEHIFGIYRFSVQGEQILRPTWTSKTYCAASIVFHVGTYLYFFNWEDLANEDNALIEIFSEIPSITVLIQYFGLVITTTLLYNVSHQNILSSLADLDSELMITSHGFYKKSANKTNKWLGFVFIILFITAMIDFSQENFMNLDEILFMPLYIVQRLEVLLFCLIIVMLRNRLDIINGYIRKFLEEKDNIVSVFTLEGKEGIKTMNMIGKPSNSNMKVRDLALMYNSIGSICLMVNNNFNFQIFMTLLSTFCYIVITIWTSLYYYKTPSNDSEELVTVFVWCVNTLLSVAAMCLVCERLVSMRNRTKILVNQLIMDYNLPKTMRVQAKVFMELIEAWPLRVQVYDMFSVDISLMLKFISVSTTYLIVIVQVYHFV